MDFRLLGPLEIDDDQGHALELGGRQQKLVLTMLLLNRNEVVSVDRLIDALWGEQPPSSAVKNVQVYISRLRKALEGASQEGVLRTQANGYSLEVAPGELDVDRFQRLLEDGGAPWPQGRPRRPRRRCAKRSRSGAAHRWRTSPTTRSRRARSRGWRNSGSRRWRSGSRPISRSAGTTT